MSHRVLITGASGYLGGSLLARIADASLPIYDRLYALVRTEAQADAVKKYGAEPLTINIKDEAAVREAVVGNKITIVFFLIDAFSAASQRNFIKSLAEVKSTTGKDVHFLHVSDPGRIFSAGLVKYFQRKSDPVFYTDHGSQNFLQSHGSSNRPAITR